jgi:hypothetical protein
VTIGVAAVLLGLASLTLQTPVAVAVPVAAGVAVALRLRRPVPGPPIADRELDLIVGYGAVAAVVVLLVGQVLHPSLGLAVLAAAPALVAVLALGAGTRRLWHAKAAPAVVAVGWLVPWGTLGATVALAVGAALVAGTAAVAR